MHIIIMTCCPKSVHNWLFPFWKQPPNNLHSPAHDILDGSAIFIGIPIYFR